MTFITTIKAIDPLDGELKTWTGPLIQAISWKMAEQYAQENGLGYCKIEGVLYSEISMQGDEQSFHTNN